MTEEAKAFLKRPMTRYEGYTVIAAISGVLFGMMAWFIESERDARQEVVRQLSRQIDDNAQKARGARVAVDRLAAALAKQSEGE